MEENESPSKWWERYRIKIGFLFALPFLWLAQPKSGSFLVLGLLASFLGILLRQWAAGCIVKNDELTTSGPYGIVRNPLYLGSLLAACGVLFSATTFEISFIEPTIDPMFFFWILLLVLVKFVYMPKIYKEELQLQKIYAGAYEDYRKKTPSLFPGRIRFSHLDFTSFRWQQWRKNKEYASLIGYALISSFLIARYTLG